MGRRIESIQDLIEEAKIRFLWWFLFIFSITYFLSHTSKSMWMNIPVAVLIAILLRHLANEVEFHLKVPYASKHSYLSHLEKKRLSVNDSRLSTAPPPSKWRTKFDSPVVEAAVEDFVNKIIQDFVTDLWYSDITPDKEAPELMRVIILEALGEVAGRIKEVNIVDLLTRDIVDLIGDNLELFRKTQASIGRDVMVTLSSEERDERLKHHLMASKELHPALVSAESEYKVLQRLVAGFLTLVLRPKEAQCPLVRCIAREFVTCLVLQPIMKLVSPEYINQLVELILLQVKDFLSGLDDDLLSKADNHSVAEGSVKTDESASKRRKDNQEAEMTRGGKDEQRKRSLEASLLTSSNILYQESVQPKVADWARVLDAATQRRTEVLAPENLENMWAIGRHYKDKINKAAKGHPHIAPDNNTMITGSMTSTLIDQAKDGSNKKKRVSLDVEGESYSKELPFGHEVEIDHTATDGNKYRLKRSCSTSDLHVESEQKTADISGSQRLLISEDFYSPDFASRSVQKNPNDLSGSVIRAAASHFPKLMCRVVGAYFEKIGSKSFAVYSIAVSDAQNNKWFVKRRYRNFERLHRQLKDIPNYNLHLPPKRIFSSSTEDAFVHQRCIQLDRYLQDLLAIANVAEQHEVWDFLSASSKNYSFGKSPSVMKTLAVNVDDAVDDIVRQFKGGFSRKGFGSSSSHYEELTSAPTRNLSLNEHDLHSSLGVSIESAHNLSDNEEGDKDGSCDHETEDSDVKASGWHSDNELKSKSFPPRVVKKSGDTFHSNSGTVRPLLRKSSVDGVASLPVMALPNDDSVGVPPEWTPPNVTVPLLNLVDKVFQLNRRGWIRRQAFWISKQILQLVMEDAIDDWLFMQINFLRREDVIAEGIRWIKDILWPDGKFFLKLEITGGGSDEIDYKSFQATPRASSRKSQSSSFEMQLEATRRTSFVKKALFNGAPAPLVSMIGAKQYKRCARDIFYFLQSSIFLKQVAYTGLELVLVSIFPELKDLVEDIDKKMQKEQKA